ncbi:MAG: hypothetical protein NVV74_21035 [Magnetospirillum sp.]|nr:hypothetical protein [Magnetospirillum sp.]
MAQGVNGHVTINVGLANGIGNGKRAGPSPHSLGEEERNRRARRLRKEGWSYRRIAASLGMSYSVVCHLLDGDEARIPYAEPVGLVPLRPVVVVSAPPVTPVPANEGEAPAVSASVRIEELSLQVRVLQQRLDAVLAQNEGLRQNLARLERVLVATLQSEHKVLGQRLSTVVKSLLERMLPTSFRARPTDTGEGPHD